MGTDALRFIRFAAIGLIAVLAFVWAAIGLGWLQNKSSPGDTQTLGRSMIVPFQLLDQNGAQVSERDILGRPTVLFFGFTFCPDVCPTTLASLSAVLGRMGSDADKVRVFFITVDPERDTPDTLKQYLSAFDPRIRALTGAPDRIAAVTKALGVYAAKVKLDGGGYSLDHTASVFLLDAEGRFKGTIAYGEEPDVALAKLKNLLRD